MSLIGYYTAKHTQAIDHYAIENLHIPSIRLMKQAAFFAFQTLKTAYPDLKKLYVLCGSGNNGGDGYILAQYAALDGMEVKVAQLSHKTPKGDALIALTELEAIEVEIAPFKEAHLDWADILVDAIFGTGLNQAVQSPHTEIFATINQAQKPVLAMDIPSGLNADTGVIMGAAIRAQHTCTFITHKIGLQMYQGQDLAGTVHYSNLNLPPKALKSQAYTASSRTLAEWLAKLPFRSQTQHKGSRGTVALVGGNHGMMGAIQMAAFAALKSGAGLIKVFSQAEHLTSLTQQHPEFMCYPAKQFSEQAPSAQVIAVGPGLGLDNWAENNCLKVLSLNTPKVMDADALKWLAQNHLSRNDWVLTPHPGEAATLLDCTTFTVQQDRIAAIKALQTQYGGVVVLKGNGTLIYDGERLELCPFGNPGMAVGGMGDVLTGIIAGLIAQKMPLFEAACLGVYLHACAGDRVALSQGEAAVTPSDLIDGITQLQRIAP